MLIDDHLEIAKELQTRLTTARADESAIGLFHIISLTFSCIQSENFCMRFMNLCMKHDERITYHIGCVTMGKSEANLIAFSSESSSGTKADRLFGV